MRLTIALFTVAVMASQTWAARTLSFDATSKDFFATPGETNAAVSFVIGNVAKKPISIFSLKPSCGCTYVNSPMLPLVLKPKSEHTFVFDTDLRGKAGKLHKSATVYSSAGRFVLSFSINIPHQLSTKSRRENMMIAENNRQSVFSGTCADCHVKPTVGKTGRPLYEAACGICHETAHRADMVPDLAKVSAENPEEFWTQMIAQGRKGTLMPAFSREHGGPLSDAQIRSLVEFMSSDYRNSKAAVDSKQ